MFTPRLQAEQPDPDKETTEGCDAIASLFSQGLPSDFGLGW